MRMQARERAGTISVVAADGSNCTPKATCRGRISPSDRPKSIPADAIDRSADRCRAPTGPRPSARRSTGPTAGEPAPIVSTVQVIVEQWVGNVVQEADQFALKRIDGTDCDRSPDQCGWTYRVGIRQTPALQRRQAVANDQQLDRPVVVRSRILKWRRCITRPGDDDHRHERLSRRSDRESPNAPAREASARPRQSPKGLAPNDGLNPNDPPSGPADPGESHPNDPIPWCRRPRRRHR
jgi:hypothetical protein